MSLRSTFAMMMTVLLWAAPAEAKKPKPFKCDWQGEAADAFTGVDSRTTGRSWGNGVTIRFGVPNDGVSKGVAQLRYAGAFEQPFGGPIQFLLMDESVIAVAVDPPVRGTLAAGSYEVFSIFDMPLTLTVADLQQIATSGGVSKIRFNMPNGSSWDMRFNEGDEGQLPGYANCALNPPAPQ
ncbi:MAG: hypothetical protein KKI08_25725 [Armatimonadetes bacterium]|nr:hypothetical protein [Armatimonadota bacterium]